MSGNPNGATVGASTAEHGCIINEPLHKGGADLRPTPLDSLLKSLAACETVVLRPIASAVGFKDLGLKAECTGALICGARAVQGAFGPCFTKVKVILKTENNAPEIRVGHLKRIVGLRCPAMILFSGADVKMDAVWNATPHKRSGHSKPDNLVDKALPY